VTDRLIGGKYRLIQPIRKGGMGEVWEAERNGDGVRVAVKRILETARRKSVDNLLRFRKQAEVLAGLSHENVVRVFDYIESDDDYYIVMELVPGDDLEEYLRKNGPLSVPRFLEASILLAETIAFIHKNGVLHGDIKPGNIIVFEENGRLRIKLLDFGMPHLLALQPSGPHAIGSFSYMSPEQSGILKRPVEKRSDLYSLGIVFYRCLAGELPYSAPSVYALIHKHIAVEAPPLHEIRPDIPQIIGEIVRKLMNKEITLRYENADLLARDLRTVQKGLAGEEDLLKFVPGFSLKPRIESSVLRLVGREEEYRKLTGFYEQAARAACVFPARSTSTNPPSRIRASSRRLTGSSCSLKCICRENRTGSAPA
jgi:serine/threonine-protein kinase